MKPYSMISNAKTFAFSAENPTGTRAGGSRGGDCTKLSPTVTIRAGETVTLVDTDGPGMIQSIWFTGYVGHSFVIRMYWDNCEYPSVEAPISAFFGTAYDENFVDRDGKYAVLNSAQILVAPGRGLNCYWEMPFKKHCRITMENRSREVRDLYYMITGWHGALPEDLPIFFLMKKALCNLKIRIPNSLNITAYLAIRDGAHNSLTRMGKIKENSRIILQKGLAILPVGQRKLLITNSPILKSLLQKAPDSQRKPLILVKAHPVNPLTTVLRHRSIQSFKKGRII